MSRVVLNNVTRNFGAIEAVKDLSMTINDGEFVVLLGPTGAGKTTTLRLIAGLEKPDRGTVEIAGTDVTAMAPTRRDVAFVFQQYSLYPHYTVFDNMAFPLRAPGRNLTPEQIKKRVHEIAELLRIESKLENRATQLSGGEMQRVSIGRALVRQPEIFLMDEPLSSLDAKLREDLRVELKRIQRELNATILYVTHDQLEAMTMADRIGVLSSGKLVQLDEPRKVYETPSNIYAAMRLGSPQINILDASSLKDTDLPANTHSVGVRPEDIVLGSANGTLAKVLTVEHLGVETVILMESEGRNIRAMLGGDAPLAEGDETSFAIREGSAICFDRQGEIIS